MKYYLVFLTALLAVLFFAGEGSAAGFLGNSADREPPYAETGWEKLMPPDWNPAKVFDGLNMDKLEDNDPQVVKAMEEFQKILDEAPVNPSMQNKAIAISGFVASLEFTGKAALKEFLLVPYFGACIHVPPPPANQIIHVTLEKPRMGIRAMDAVTVYGKLLIQEVETDMGRSGYGMKADFVEPYSEKHKKNR